MIILNLNVAFRSHPVFRFMAFHLSSAWKIISEVHGFVFWRTFGDQIQQLYWTSISNLKWKYIKWLMMEVIKRLQEALNDLFPDLIEEWKSCVDLNSFTVFSQDNKINEDRDHWYFDLYSTWKQMLVKGSPDLHQVWWVFPPLLHILRFMQHKETWHQL